jgi:DNA-binding GntR family transcriptional regulator
MPARPKKTKAPPIMAEADIAIVRIAPETSFKNKAYEALKEAILKMDIYATARKKDISALRGFFKDFNNDRLPQDHVEEYSKANIAFHQALISLSESPVLVDMTNDILLHVRGYRQLTIGRVDRLMTSLPEHMAIIEALEERNTELAEQRARDHTLGLAAYVETHGQELFT